MAIYKGSGKRFFQVVAEQLQIPTTDENDKGLTMDVLKDEIAQNVDGRTLLVLPEAKRLTTGIRYWLEDLMVRGVRVCCFAAVNPGKDIFLEMQEIEIALPLGLQVEKARLAELQSLAGRNPMLARKVVRNEKLGLNKSASPQHTKYVVIMPVIIACLMAFGIARFIGMGTGNKGLYITGGVTLVAGMTLKQLGGVRGARKRLGQ
ncbi:MAG: hypothetical protein AAF289_00050 [Cyanobacteria bacterium P01_A01_bin.135]